MLVQCPSWLKWQRSNYLPVKTHLCPSHLLRLTRRASYIQTVYKMLRPARLLRGFKMLIALASHLLDSTCCIQMAYCIYQNKILIMKKKIARQGRLEPQLFIPHSWTLPLSHCVSEKWRALTKNLGHIPWDLALLNLKMKSLLVWQKFVKYL